MTEMQAVIGRLQLGRIPAWHAARSCNAEKIRAAARKLPSLRIPEIPGYAEHAWYKCYLFVRPEKLKTGWSRDRIAQEISKHGVPCYSGTCSEVYMEKAFENTDFRPEKRLAVAKELGETSIMFLVHPTLTQAEISKTCEILDRVMTLATV
jgi:dTDP-4-amino-4,6-dideoxygalactose transaminase